jgi:hypothetical protein
VACGEGEDGDGGGWLGHVIASTIDSTVLTSRIPCCTASPMTTDGGSPAKAATVDVPPPPHPLFHDRGEGERERKRERENWCRLQTSLRDRPLESGRRGDLELGLLDPLCSSPPPPLAFPLRVKCENVQFGCAPSLGQPRHTRGRRFQSFEAISPDGSFGSVSGTSLRDSGDIHSY